jgi:hypothetical protein
VTSKVTFDLACNNPIKPIGYPPKAILPLPPLPNLRGYPKISIYYDYYLTDSVKVCPYSSKPECVDCHKERHSRDRAADPKDLRGLAFTTRPKPQYGLSHVPGRSI